MNETETELLEKILKELKKSNEIAMNNSRMLSRLNRGFEPIAEKLKIETKIKKKQKRSFEASRHFNELSEWKTAFVPSEDSTEYMTASEVQKYLIENAIPSLPLSVTGSFLNYFFKNEAVHKILVPGTTGMTKVYKIKLA